MILVMALVPLGAWVAMGEGMVLEWVPGVCRNMPVWIQKPLTSCPRCMVSAWGVPTALLVFPDLNLWLLPVYMLGACGLQELLHR